MAILTSRPNSHPFEERKLLLTESSKIGRSVAKSRPALNNCIFDCKVLSRNHAILWYENEKVFLVNLGLYFDHCHLLSAYVNTLNNILSCNCVCSLRTWRAWEILNVDYWHFAELQLDSNFPASERLMQIKFYTIYLLYIYFKMHHNSPYLAFSISRLDDV